MTMTKSKPKPRAVQLAAIQAVVTGLGEPPNRDYVPMSVWGKDHYSTLGYLETRVVDHKGTVAKQHMRTDTDRHPGMGWRHPLSLSEPEKKFPTRLAHGLKLSDHDDWDVADDLCMAGLIEKHGTGLHPVIKLTEQGELVAAALRAHEGAGGNFGDFRFAG